MSGKRAGGCYCSETYDGLVLLVCKGILVTKSAPMAISRFQGAFSSPRLLCRLENALNVSRSIRKMCGFIKG